MAERMAEDAATASSDERKDDAADAVAHSFRSGAFRERVPVRERLRQAARLLLTKRNLAWAILALAAAATVHFAARLGLSPAPLWSFDMLLRMLVFGALYGCGMGYVALEYPDKSALALAGAWFVYSSVVVGPLAPLVVLLVLWSCYCMGALAFARFPAALTGLPHGLLLLGLAGWAYLISVTAQWGIHFWPVYLAALALPVGVAAYFRVHVPRLGKTPSTPDGLIDLSIVCLPLALQWLAALKPEVGRDALSTHIVVPARMASQHFWAFDVREFLWALKPMGAEWSFTPAWMLGGESAARLLNWALFGVTCWLLHDLLKRVATPRLAALLTAALASTPLALEATASLRPEVLLGALLLACVTFLRWYLKSRTPAYLYAAAFLAAMAATCTTTAPVYVVLLAAVALPLIAMAFVEVRSRVSIIATGIGVLAGGVTYLRAWLATGNPLFPYASSTLGSDVVSVAKGFRGDGVKQALEWTAWFDLTFRPELFPGGSVGLFGFLFFALAPLTLFLAWRRRPLYGLMLAWVSFAGMAATLVFDARLHKLYPALPLLTLAIGVAIASLRMRSVTFQVSLQCVTGAIVLANLSFLPSAGVEHRDLFLNQLLNRSSERRYVEKHAPERRLLEDLSVRAPGAGVALLESDAVGAFEGRAMVNSWHSYEFFTRLAGASSVEDVLGLTKEYSLGYVIAPSAKSEWPLRSVYTREFTGKYTRLVMQAGDMELRQVMQEPVKDAAKPVAAGAGVHDDVTAATEFKGPWTRTLDAPHALNRTLVWSKDPRSQVTIHFNGTAITPLHTGAPDRCEALMSLDGGEEIPFFMSYEQVRWQARGPRIMTSPGAHTLVIRMPHGDAGAAAATPCTIDLDGFIVE